MCWQDVKIWRTQKTVWRQMPGTGGIQQILPANPLRVAIIIGIANGGNLTVSTDPAMAASTGLLQTTTGQPFVIHIKEYGTTVQDAWYCRDVAGFPALSYAEVFLPRDERQLVNE